MDDLKKLGKRPDGYSERILLELSNQFKLGLAGLP